MKRPADEIAMCTIVDSAYLSRLIALHRSLREVDPAVVLYVFCADDETKSILDRLAMPGMSTLALASLEEADPGLLAVRADRTPVEYMWTAKPAMCLFLLRSEGRRAVTYVDSDLYFYASPRHVTSQLDDPSVAILPHRFPAHRRSWEDVDGTFNASYLHFRGDVNGRAVLSWWRERCLEWCHDRIEPGRRGDQRYLDDWPERFPGVRVIEDPGAGLAPWNSGRYGVRASRDGLMVDEQPLVFHHFQSLRLFEGNAAVRRALSRTSRYRLVRDPPLLWSLDPGYEVAEGDLDLLWDPYVERLGAVLSELRRLEPEFSGGVAPLTAGDIAVAAARRVRRSAGGG